MARVKKTSNNCPETSHQFLDYLDSFDKLNTLDSFILKLFHCTIKVYINSSSMEIELHFMM
jgi:hypothetical protein